MRMGAISDSCPCLVYVSTETTSQCDQKCEQQTFRCARQLECECAQPDPGDHVYTMESDSHHPGGGSGTVWCSACLALPGPLLRPRPRPGLLQWPLAVALAKCAGAGPPQGHTVVCAVGRFFGSFTTLCDASKTLFFSGRSLRTLSTITQERGGVATVLRVTLLAIKKWPRDAPQMQ